MQKVPLWLPLPGWVPRARPTSVCTRGRVGLGGMEQDPGGHYTDSRVWPGPAEKRVGDIGRGAAQACAAPLPDANILWAPPGLGTGLPPGLGERVRVLESGDFLWQARGWGKGEGKVCLMLPQFLGTWRQPGLCGPHS